MGFPNDRLEPAGWVTVTSARHCNLFLENWALSFTLSAPTAERYEVVDYYGTLVAQGTVSGTTLTLTALPLGWYRMYLRRATNVEAYGTLIGASMFSVIRQDARFPDPPAWGTVPSANVKFQEIDHITRGIAMLGPHRLSVDTAEDPFTDYGGSGVGFGPNIANNLRDQRDYLDPWYTNFVPDPVRPRPSLLQFPNGTTATQAQKDGVRDTVKATWPFVKNYEGWANEPVSGDTAFAAAHVADMLAFRTAVKAGHPDAQVLGPNPVSIVGGPRSGEAAQGIPANLSSLLADNRMDQFTFHAYNLSNGDIALGRRVLDSLMELLARNGRTGKTLWQSEWGAFAINGGMSEEYATFNPGVHSRQVFLQRFLFEQYGIPKERDYYFYDGSHGFLGFAGWWKNADSSLIPMIPLMRVYSQEVWGKTWASALDFGPVENDHFLGNRFTSTNGTAMLAFIAGGPRSGTVRLQLTGATKATVIGAFGASSVARADRNGVITITPGEVPIYVRLPVGVNATVVPTLYGPNLTTWGARVLGNDVDMAGRRSVVNNLLENALYAGTSSLAAPEFRDAPPPSAVTVELRDARTFDTIIVSCPVGYTESAFLDFDVEYQDTVGVWRILETIVEPFKKVPCRVPVPNGGTELDLFYTGRHVFVSKFTPVTGKAVRVSVRHTTLTYNYPAYPYRRELVTVREIAVYNRSVASA